MDRDRHGRVWDFGPSNRGVAARTQRERGEGLKTRILISTALALGLVLALTAAAGAGKQATVTQVNIIAPLSDEEEVPKPTGNVDAATGAFTGTATATGNGARFTWKLVFRELSGPAIAAHIHIAARGEPGPVVAPLCGPCTNNQTGSGTLEPGDVSALRAGRLYVNVHTAQNPNGEVRGQVASVDKQSRMLTPGQETHRLKGNVSKAKGGFTGEVRKSDNKGTELRWRLGWEGLTGRALSAHIHIGARGKAGAVMVFICGTKKTPCRNNRGGVAKLSLAQAQALETKDVYVNVHTAKNPAGEIRAQLRKARLTLRAQG
jgi:hypothetical protein